MIDLITYWVLVTLLTLLLLSSVSPIIIVIGNHAATFVSRGKLHKVWFSNKIIRFFRMQLWMKGVLDKEATSCVGSKLLYTWNFGEISSLIFISVSFVGWFISLMEYGEGSHTYNFVSGIHNIASVLAPHVSYVTIALGGYIGLLLGARAVFGVHQKLSKLLKQESS